MLTIGGEVYDVMRATLVSLDHCAQAIIKTADDFVATDDQAAQDYQHLSGGLRSLDVPTHTVPPAYDPSTSGAVNPQQPTYMGANDFKPHDPVILAPTPDPLDPATDHEQRDDTEKDDQEDTPVVPPEVAVLSDMTTAAALADVLDIRRASEAISGEVRGVGRVSSWDREPGAVMACAVLGLPLPTGSVVVHRELVVRLSGAVSGDRAVPWWVTADGTVHCVESWERPRGA
jgi:hypothetical protein